MLTASSRTSRPRRLPPFLAAALVGALGASACDRLGGGGGEYVLGLAAPLTDGEGKPDSYGVRTQKGALLAVEEINQAWAAEGRRLVLRQVDDHGNANQALKVAGQLADDPAVLAVVGHVYSGATLKAAERYQGGDAGEPVAAVATSATSPLVSRAGEWIFRVASSDSANAVALAEAARTLGRRVAVAYDNTEYGRGLAGPFTRALQAGGVEVLESDPFLDDTEDLRPFLRRMQSRGVDLLFVAGLDAAAARIIAQAREVGLTARVLGGDGIEGLAGAGHGNAFDGTAVGVLFHPEASDSARAFAQRYRKKYGEDPDSQAALAYDAVRLLAGALEAGHHDRASIRAYLETVGRNGAPPFQGAAGPVAFDANGDPVGKPFTVGTIRAGRILVGGGAR